MANLKSFDIRGRVAFSFLSEIERDEAAALARWFLSPSAEVHIEYEHDGYDPNDHGGQTSMYMVRMHGREAVRTSLLERWANLIAKHGRLIEAAAYDLEYDTNPTKVLWMRPHP